MEYKTVEEVYAANDSIRDKFKQTLDGLTEEQATSRPDGEKWSVAEVVEHVAIVNGGMLRICAKLLGKAEAAGKTNDGGVSISPSFLEAGASAATQKLEAPEMVHPVGGASLADSIAKLDELQSQYAELKSKFETVDGVEARFPHPYFGDLSAQDWLVLAGAHEARHMKQVRRILQALS